GSGPRKGQRQRVVPEGDCAFPTGSRRAESRRRPVAEVAAGHAEHSVALRLHPPVAPMLRSAEASRAACGMDNAPAGFALPVLTHSLRSRRAPITRPDECSARVQMNVAAMFEKAETLNLRKASKPSYVCEARWVTSQQLQLLNLRDVIYLPRGVGVGGET